MLKANVFRCQRRAQQGSDEESRSTGSNPGSSDGAVSCRLHKIVSSAFVMRCCMCFYRATCYRHVSQAGIVSKWMYESRWCTGVLIQGLCSAFLHYSVREFGYL